MTEVISTMYNLIKRLKRYFISIYRISTTLLDKMATILLSIVLYRFFFTFLLFFFLLAFLSLKRISLTTHAKAITTKSSQFHASLRQVKGCRMKPLAITLTADSNVQMPVNITLKTTNTPLSFLNASYVILSLSSSPFKITFERYSRAKM